MEEITEKEFNKAAALAPEKIESKFKKLTNKELKQKLLEMENPVQAQKQMAVQIKVSLERKMEEEMNSKGYLSDATRRWVESYNKILEKIQKALHGDKPANLNLNKITHSAIATKIREAMNS